MSKSIFRELDWYSRQNINLTFQKIATEIKKIKKGDKLPSISQLSAKAFAAPASINRFCNQLGYNGYKELINRVKIELELGENISDLSLKKTDDYSSEYIFNTSFENIVKDIRKINQLFYNKLVKTSRQLVKYKKIYIISSEPLTMYFYTYLVQMGINAFVIKTQKAFDWMVENEIVDSNAYCMFFAIGNDSLWIEKCIQKVNNFLINYIIFLNKKFIDITDIDKMIFLESTNEGKYYFQEELLLLHYILNQILKLLLSRLRIK
ncbi:hypothetical protein [Spiroplasma endosymbiont of Aspidapion aeneum]|uniref:MurR/RpiR family transcriptional regulator n=1 Tax=Spiroplasma endosymbiont of Aspidapion aeneum TaxID=3066276 RepID=UPI00313EE004